MKYFNAVDGWLSSDLAKGALIQPVAKLTGGISKRFGFGLPVIPIVTSVLGNLGINLPVVSHTTTATPSSTPTPFTPFVSRTATSTVAAASVSISPKSPITVLDHSASSCLDSTATDSDINSLFFYGGVNTTVYLCPSAIILIVNAISFTAESQTLTTLGFPTDATRATIIVGGATQTAAIVAQWSYASVRNLIVDGNRPLLGQITEFTSALIEMGGQARGQLVDSVRAFGSSLSISPIIVEYSMEHMLKAHRDNRTAGMECRTLSGGNRWRQCLR